MESLSKYGIQPKIHKEKAAKFYKKKLHSKRTMVCSVLESA